MNPDFMARLSKITKINLGNKASMKTLIRLSQIVEEPKVVYMVRDSK